VLTPAKYLPAIVRPIGSMQGREMNRREMVSGLAMVVAFLAGAYGAAAGDRAEEAQVLVAKTIDYFAANGAEATIGAVNAGGAFIRASSMFSSLAPMERVWRMQPIRPMWARIPAC
jgi:hypothetical protein